MIIKGVDRVLPGYFTWYNHSAWHEVLAYKLQDKKNLRWKQTGYREQRVTPKEREAMIW